MGCSSRQTPISRVTEPMVLLVGDIAPERQRLRDLGTSLGDDIQGTYSTLAHARNPDGNQITLATPPSPLYPPA